MAVTFPPSPTVGESVTDPTTGAVWVWDGEKWTFEAGSPPPPTGPAFNNVGRNILHNGLFNIQQRGEGPWTTAGSFTADRWLLVVNTDTVSAGVGNTIDSDKSQIGDEAAENNLAVTFDGSSVATAVTLIQQQTEDVYRTAGKTLTLSFWALSQTGTPQLGVGWLQYMGSGGTPSPSAVGPGTAFTLSTTWTRYSLTIDVPSLIGETIGTNNDHGLVIRFYFSSGANNAAESGIGVQSGRIFLWGVQLEVGSVVTPLEKLDPQVDLGNCERFYVVVNSHGLDFDTSTPADAIVSANVSWPTTMRAVPTVTAGTGNISNLTVGTLSTPSPNGWKFGGTATAGGAGGFWNPTITASADL